MRDRFKQLAHYWLWNYGLIIDFFLLFVLGVGGSFSIQLQINITKKKRIIISIFMANFVRNSIPVICGIMIWFGSEFAFKGISFSEKFSVVLFFFGLISFIQKLSFPFVFDYDIIAIWIFALRHVSSQYVHLVCLVNNLNFKNKYSLW